MSSSGRYSGGAVGEFVGDLLKRRMFGHGPAKMMKRVAPAMPCSMTSVIHMAGTCDWRGSHPWFQGKGYVVRTGQSATVLESAAVPASNVFVTSRGLRMFVDVHKLNRTGVAELNPEVDKLRWRSSIAKVVRVPVPVLGTQLITLQYQ